MANYLALNIGRNIGDTPMTAVEWNTFQGEAMNVLDDTVAYARLHRTDPTVVASGSHLGTGEWEDVPEESAVVWLVTDIPLAGNAASTYLQDKAERLARAYGQDAIAVIVGTSTLVAGE